MSSPNPTAMRYADADLYILGERVSADKQQALRAKDQWPEPSFYLGVVPYLLYADADNFIEQRKLRVDADRARLRQRSQKANAARWGRARATAAA